MMMAIRVLTMDALVIVRQNSVLFATIQKEEKLLVV